MSMLYRVGIFSFWNANGNKNSIHDKKSAQNLKTHLPKDISCLFYCSCWANILYFLTFLIARKKKTGNSVFCHWDLETLQCNADTINPPYLSLNTTRKQTNVFLSVILLEWLPIQRTSVTSNSFFSHRKIRHCACQAFSAPIIFPKSKENVTC